MRRRYSTDPEFVKRQKEYTRKYMERMKKDEKWMAAKREKSRLYKRNRMSDPKFRIEFNKRQREIYARKRDA